MDELIKRLEQLQRDFDAGAAILKLETLDKELAALNEAMLAPDFWNDSQAAQVTAKQQAALEARVAPWHDVRSRLHDTLELARMNDTSVQTDIERDTAAL